MTPQGHTKSMTLRIDETLAERVRAIAEVEETTVSDVIRDALAEHVERQRSDPEFQTMLKRNLERHEELLSMLADG
ncbi:MAG: ribbon-helix-helix protein, CopG family [Acidimicrobiaceae bacterium]|nr:ribbon-helix-helix domain-containing protein [Acidimicrobiia bacterium]MCY4492379.1 ribbon-helix-helix protein, CopG family [Acidimicrobiaceae bacterium]